METIRPNERFALYDFWYYGFGYYMRREVTELETPQELRDYFGEPGSAYCLVRKKNLDEAVGILDGLPYSVDPALGGTSGKFAMLVRVSN